MKSFTPVLSFLFVLFVACTPPDEVRQSRYSEIPESGLFAHIPVCLFEGQVYLGDSYADFSSNSGLGEPEHIIENDCGVTKREYMLARKDTLITCSFKGGRLIEVQSITHLPKNVTKVKDAFDTVSEVYPCAGELGTWMDKEEKQAYLRQDDAFRECFYLDKSELGYTKLVYKISYFNNLNCNSKNQI
jgi:hypothetical protein